MLTVKTCIQRSPIHGVGVFAAEAIPKGVLVYRFEPDVDMTFPWKAFKHMSPEAQEILRKYAMKEGDTIHLDGDNSHFMNHSDDPNMAPRPDNDTWYATRDIRKGEEIVCDYNHFENALCARGISRTPKTESRLRQVLREFANEGATIKSGGAPTTYVGPNPDQVVATRNSDGRRRHQQAHVRAAVLTRRLHQWRQKR